MDDTQTFWSLMDITLIGLWSLLLTGAVVALVSPLARAMRLVDEPDSRKQHIGSIPLVGGIGIAVAVSIVLAWSGAFAEPTTGMLLIIGSILAALGVLDDYIDISARYRLVAQIAVGVALCFVAGLQISSVGDLTGTGPVVLTGIAAVAFTIMCSVGVFNSINMIDGIDGLAGTIVLLSAGAMASIAFSGNDFYSAGVLFSVVCAVLGYLAFNLGVFGQSNKVFMGDAGSLFLGFVLLWFFIDLSQGENAPMSPVTAGWIFGVPLADTIAVIVGRLVRGEHPLAAGRDHIHHRLLNHGLDGHKVLVILGVYHGALISIGLMYNGQAAAEPFMFWGFVAITIAHFFVLNTLLPHRPVSDGKAAICKSVDCSSGVFVRRKYRMKCTSD